MNYSTSCKTATARSNWLVKIFVYIVFIIKVVMLRRYNLFALTKTESFFDLTRLTDFSINLYY